MDDDYDCDSGNSVDEDDDVADDEGSNHDSGGAPEQVQNQQNGSLGGDAAAPLPLFLPPVDDGLLPFDIAVGAIHDAAGNGNHVEDNNAQDDMNNDDEWDIDDWNEGMREGWDWVPLAVVCFCQIHQIMLSCRHMCSEVLSFTLQVPFFEFLGLFGGLRHVGVSFLQMAVCNSVALLPFSLIPYQTGSPLL